MPIFLKHKAYINFIMLLRVIGYLLVIESAFMTIPLITAIVYQDAGLKPFILSILITGASGCGMMILKPKSKDMGKREAILLTGMTWVILSLFGMLPSLLCQTHTSITDAFFETMSGFTTTGVSVLESLEFVPKSILMWRSVVQWIGGLGIILFTLAVVPMLNNAGGMKMFNAEVTGITHDKLRPRVSFTAKGLWLIYISLTLVLIILLSFSRMSVFEAICHGMSTMSTGGFSTSDSSIGTWESTYVKLVMSFFMFIGGVNFSLIYVSIQGKIKNVLTNTALKWYLGIIGVSTIIFSANTCFGTGIFSFDSMFVDPLFQTISLVSSTGLIAPAYQTWNSLSIIVMLFLTAIGACAGSTSGGMKIDRFVILVKFIKNEFYKFMHPSAVTTVTINKRGTTTSIVNKTLAFIFLYGMVIIAGGLTLSLMGLPLSTSFFASLQAISNAGLVMDFNGQSIDLTVLPDLSKWVLSLIMLIGRLELFTIILLFTPAFWKR